MLSADNLSRMMAASSRNREGQLAQTKFRLRLVQNWPISEGSRVLEIGCGQGDMTCVLASAVGGTGSVLAVDIADPSYGAPVTIEESARTLLASCLADRMEFRFNFNVLDAQNVFPNDAFDAVVLAHCTWYFASLDDLQDSLRKIRPWAKRLCLSEWDMQPQAIDQVGHFLAMLIQGQIEVYKRDSHANVRTPYSRETLRQILRETGWLVVSESLIDCSEIEDAKWEIEATLVDSLIDVNVLELPLKLRELIKSQIDILARIREQGAARSLPSYSMVAERL